MTPDDLDRILSSEDLLEPSSDFVMDVMAAVRRQAAEPAPVRFPWSRFIAGLAAALVTAAAGTMLLRLSAPALAAMTPPVAAPGAVTPALGHAPAAGLLSPGPAALPPLPFPPSPSAL